MIQKRCETGSVLNIIPIIDLEAFTMQHFMANKEQALFFTHIQTLIVALFALRQCDNKRGTEHIMSVNIRAAKSGQAISG